MNPLLDSYHNALWLIPRDQVLLVWKDVETFIKQTDDEDTTSKDIYENLKSGKWSLWIGMLHEEITFVGTTSFVTYPSGKMCRVETLAGDNMDDWFYMLKDLEEWAKLNGCIAMDIFGRKGWEKVLKPAGYEFESVLLRKRL